MSDASATVAQPELPFTEVQFSPNELKQVIDLELIGNLTQDIDGTFSNNRVIQLISLAVRKRSPIPVSSIQILYSGKLVQDLVGYYPINILFFSSNATEPQLAKAMYNILDVNECLQKHVCTRENMFCRNTNGSYTCDCDPGYELSTRCLDEYDESCKKNQYCKDVDECADPKLNTCLKNSECVNTEGSFECECSAGYKPSEALEGEATHQIDCLDVDECALGLDDCSPNAICINTDGGFSCKCNEDYEGDGKECTLVSKCKNPSQCDEHAHCRVEVNENNAAEDICECNSGFDGNGTKGFCADINECETKPYPCVKKMTLCVNTIGSYECQCEQGYFSVNSLLYDCEDIDECKNGRNKPQGHDCSKDATCINTAGGFECDCNDDFDSDFTFKGHTDKGCLYNKQPEIKIQGDTVTVINQYGSYHELGIAYDDNITTNDTNREYSIDWSPILRKGVLMEVGFFSEAITYRLKYSKLRPDVVAHRHLEVIDVDECDANSTLPDHYKNACHPEATCANTNGSYTCTCPEVLSCDGCDGFLPRNWSSNPWFGYVPQGYVNGSGCKDATAPVIQLFGAAEIFVPNCKCGCSTNISFPEEWETCGSLAQSDSAPSSCSNDPPTDCPFTIVRCFQALDNVDGDVTSRVNVTIEDDMIEKKRTFRYTVSDKAGNTAAVVRTFQVVDREILDEMNRLKGDKDKLNTTVGALSLAVSVHAQWGLVLLSSIVAAVLLVTLFTGVFAGLKNLVLYLVYPSSLLGNRAGFIQGMGLWLMITSFGTIEPVQRRREATTAWCEMRDDWLSAVQEEEEEEEAVVLASESPEQ